MWVQVRKRH